MRRAGHTWAKGSWAHTSRGYHWNRGHWNDSRAISDYLPAERHERKLHQLEVLPGERDPNDRDA